jgi:hyperosmotically inducible periplasmic protein
MTASSKLTPTLSSIALAAVAALALTACGRDDGQTVGQKVDSAIATTEAKADAAKAEVKQEMAEAKTATQGAADTAAQKMENAADKVAAVVDDATVTASVNAELAKDPSLSAIKIDVDTQAGRVALKGSAPDADSRERATRLAQAVKGVVSVDNQLRIGS